VVLPSRVINLAPNGDSERLESNNKWYLIYKESVSTRVAHTNRIRVNTTNRDDMTADGVAITPERTFSYYNASVSPEMNHGNTLEPCSPPLIPQWPMQQLRRSSRVSTQTRLFYKEYQGHNSVEDCSDDDPCIGEVSYSGEKQSEEDDDDVVSPPATKRRRRRGSCTELIYYGIPHPVEGIDWTGWTQQQFKRLVRWSRCLLAKCLSHTLCTRVMYFTYLLESIRRDVMTWIIIIYTPVPTGSFGH
jgi:hypothetical protein